MRFIFTLFILSLVTAVFAQDEAGIEKRFNGKTVLSYDVVSGGKKSGYVKWEYKGKDRLNDKAVDVLRVDSEAKILAFFDLNSHETIYLDSKNYLPVRVERNLVFFGNKELIIEHYDQDKGLVEVAKSVNGKPLHLDRLKQNKPICHIMALLYFFPAAKGLTPGQKFDFNLPTAKVHVEVKSLTKIKIGAQEREAFFLVGTGGKRFNVWLDKEKLVPLRLEFLFPVGSVAIVRSDL
jgi:hypothetical protein